MMIALREKKKRRRARLAALLGGMALACAGTARAADFSGAVVEIMVPANPGSGADIYARALGPFLGRHLPGEPEIRIRNVPGGGTVTASNEFELRARPDGLTVMSGSTSQVLNFVLGDSRVQYDLLGWRPFIVSTQGIAVYASPRLGIEGPEDMAALAGQHLVYGGAAASAADLRLLLSFDMLGWETTNVWGTDRGQARLAFERGEFTLSYDATSAYKRDVVPLVEEGMAVPLFSFGAQDEAGNFIRDPNFPELPNFQEAYEMVHGTGPEGVAYEAWLANFAMAMTLNKFFALPAGTPDDIFEAYTEAARRMLEDPEAAQARDLILEGYPQFTGAEAEEIYHQAASIEPEVLDWIDGWLQEKEGVSLRQ